MAKTKKAKIDAYASIGREYWKVNMDSAITVGNKIIKLSEEIGYDDGYSEGLVIVAIAKTLLGDYKNAESLAFTAIEKNSNKKSVLSAYMALGISNLNQTKPLKAIQYFKQALNIAIEIDDNYLIQSNYGNLATVYFQIKNYKDAKICGQRAVNLSREANNLKALCASLLQLSQPYYSLKEYDKATELLNESLVIGKTLSSYSNVAYVYYYLARINLEQKNTSDAFKNIESAKSTLAEFSPNPFLIADIDRVHGKIYYQNGEFQLAKKFLEQAYENSKKFNDKEAIHESAKYLFKVHKGLGNYEKMNAYVDVYEAYSDSIINQIEIKEVYDEIKNIELKNLELVKDQELLASRINKWLYVLYSVIISGALITVLLIYKNKKLAELNKSKTEFLSQISHEMKTPLHSIIGFTKLINSKATDPKSQEYATEISNSSSDLLYKIKNVLAFSDLNENHFQLSPSVFNLYQLLLNVNNKFFKIAKCKGLLYELEIDKSINGYHVYFDREKLERILEILLDNAIKFTNKGYVSFQGICCKKERNEIEIDFIVSDSGKGLEKDNIDKIFDFFYQEDNSLKRQFEGMGLSLAILGKYLELMESDIQVETKLNEGTTFSFRLKFPIVSNTNQKLIKSTSNIAKITAR